MNNKHLLTCLFSTEPATTTPVPATPTMVSHQRKDYLYLKPSILSADCSRRELSKFSSECHIWLEKSLSTEDQEDSRMVWASIRAVLDDEWTAILSRIDKISEKAFDEIYKIMDKIYLEKKTSSYNAFQHCGSPNRRKNRSLIASGESLMRISRLS